jgi:hypothetical protein
MRCISRGLLIKLGIFIICCQNFVYSQELQESYSWKVEDVVDATADHTGMLYVSNKQGIISKYDKNGLPLISYSGDNISPIYSIDVSHTSKIFGFYKDDQSYLILDRFLNPLNEAIFNTSLIGYASETAYAADNNIWIFDQSDLSVKKINLLNNTLQTTISVSLFITVEEWDIKQIEEYQNRLYVYNADKNVYVFDNLGNYIKRLNIMPNSNFWFDGEYLIYIEEGKILKFGLYNSEIRQIASIENSNDILKVISVNNFIYLIFKNNIIVYQ